ncbi:SWIM zinc finger protein [Popillia japonica]|uniref:SWIM zinc finger protein n=1 Tax=Popillia japonica TaxID=7064 RepID=A0AAW1N5V5_POPJA
MKKNKHLLPILGESVLQKAEIIYKQNGYFTDTILQELHSVYSTSLEQALDILDKTKVIQYYARDSKRTLYLIGKGDKQLRLFEDINFCFCETFRKDVLESGDKIMCEHVLGVKLAKITKGFVKEEMSDLYFVESLKIMSETLC